MFGIGCFFCSGGLSVCIVMGLFYFGYVIRCAEGCAGGRAGALFHIEFQ